MTPELFTVQVQGKGVRLKARVPGWVAAMVFQYAKENEQANADTGSSVEESAPTRGKGSFGL